MIEINKIREIMNLNPFNGFSWFIIFFGIGVPACIGIKLFNFVIRIYSSAIIAKYWLTRVFLHCHVAIHTNIHRRNGGVLTILSPTVTIQTTYLIDACMYFMNKINRLIRLVSLLPA